MQTETPKFHAWLAAEKEAHEAERELHAHMLQFARSACPAPLPDAVLVARAKRAKAHVLFDDAMQELKEKAKSLHHRQILPGSAQHPPSSDDSSSQPFQHSR